MKEKTLNNYALQWMEDKKRWVRASTLAAYDLILRTHILPRWGNATDISEQEAQRFLLDKLADGYRQKTVRDMLLVLKMLYAFACQQAGRPALQWNLRFPPDSSPRIRPVLTDEEQLRLILHIRQHPVPRNLGLFIALSTGMRIGEICALQWKDIDLTRKILRVEKTVMRIYHPGRKGALSEVVVGPPKSPASCREIPILDELAGLLAAVRPHPGDEFYLLTGKKTPTEPRCYRNWFRHVLDEIGIQRVKFHALRHTFASRCIDRGSDCKTVCELLGHADVSTTLGLYVHPGMDQKRRTIEKVFDFQ